MSVALKTCGIQNIDMENSVQESTIPVDHGLALAAPPTPNNGAPIYNLNIDILWRIFSINARVYWSEKYVRSRSSPLLILRRSSQVSHEWRSIILSSTVLWGMVIELGHTYWEEETLRRAGNSPLFITGVVDGVEPEDRPFFLDLLKSHWTRIQRLDVQIENHEDQNPEIWKAFQRPAPNLEIFKLHFYGDQGWDFPEQESPLFANDAPALRELQYPDETPRHISFQAPWIGQLRKLVLYSHCTVSQILDGLAYMPLLEYFALVGTDNAEEPNLDLRRNQVILPLLRTFVLGPFSFAASFFLLKHISLPSGCALFSMIFDGFVPTDQQAEYLCKLYSRLTESYLNLPPPLGPDVLMLKLNMGGHLHIGASKSLYNEAELQPRSMDFGADFDIQHQAKLPVFFVPLLLSVFSSHRYTHVTRFDFFPQWNLVKQKQLDPTGLFLSLPTVTTLSTSEFGFILLLNSYPSVFPALKTFYFKPDGVFQLFAGLIGTSVPERLADFIKRRSGNDAVAPLSIVDISELNCTYSPNRQRVDLQEWSYLDDIDGLKVILSRRDDSLEEYVCGSGSPEKLKLSSET